MTEDEFTENARALSRELEDARKEGLSLMAQVRLESTPDSYYIKGYHVGLTDGEYRIVSYYHSEQNYDAWTEGFFDGQADRKLYGR